MKKDEFGDILNSQGFKPSVGNEPNTMNSLRKQVDVEDDPVKAKVKKIWKPELLEFSTFISSCIRDNNTGYSMLAS